MAVITKTPEMTVKTNAKNLLAKTPPKITTDNSIDLLIDERSCSFEELRQLLKESDEDTKRLKRANEKLKAENLRLTNKNNQLAPNGAKTEGTNRKLNAENTRLVHEVKRITNDMLVLKADNIALTEEANLAADNTANAEAVLELESTVDEFREENAQLRIEVLEISAVTAKELECMTKQVADLQRMNMVFGDENATFRGERMNLEDKVKEFERVHDKSGGAKSLKTENKDLKSEIADLEQKIKDAEAVTATKAVELDELKGKNNRYKKKALQYRERLEESESESNTSEMICETCTDNNIKAGKAVYCAGEKCQRNKEILAKTLARNSHESERLRAALTFANKKFREIDAEIQINYQFVAAGFYAEAVYTDTNPPTVSKITEYSRIEAGEHKVGQREHKVAATTCTGNPLNLNPSLRTREQVIENAKKVMGANLAHKSFGQRKATVGDTLISVKNNFRETRMLINERRGDKSADCNDVKLQ